MANYFHPDCPMSVEEINEEVNSYCRLNEVNTHQCCLLKAYLTLKIEEEIAVHSDIMEATLLVMSPAWVHAFCASQRKYFAHVENLDEYFDCYEQMMEQFA